MTFHRLVIHSWIHMYHIRDCDRSGISIAPVTRDAAQKNEVALVDQRGPNLFVVGLSAPP
ncbi:hypothetical protein RchiOBHm_Chr5g0018251 [Rosa chinensis]|uniref:Uncharacterized protein n=1 Tax=Rosa chinensis TaxID=74649 RepID=A0A2P6Q6P5_ROSCH|nr:hypothetical protein RchiOBHm_Chr5g0018251 [Rosa chinensis]